VVKFIKRAFSTLGYMLVAQLIIQVPLMIIFFSIMFAIMVAMGMSGASGGWTM